MSKKYIGGAGFTPPPWLINLGILAGITCIIAGLSMLAYNKFGVPGANEPTATEETAGPASPEDVTPEDVTPEDVTARAALEAADEAVRARVNNYEEQEDAAGVIQPLISAALGAAALQTNNGNPVTIPDDVAEARANERIRSLEAQRDAAQAEIDGGGGTKTCHDIEGKSTPDVGHYEPFWWFGDRWVPGVGDLPGHFRTTGPTGEASCGDLSFSDSMTIMGWYRASERNSKLAQLATACSDQTDGCTASECCQMPCDGPWCPGG
jgi:hypothetical protein